MTLLAPSTIEAIAAIHAVTHARRIPFISVASAKAIARACGAEVESALHGTGFVHLWVKGFRRSYPDKGWIHVTALQPGDEIWLNPRDLEAHAAATLYFRTHGLNPPIHQAQ